MKKSIRAVLLFLNRIKIKLTFKVNFYLQNIAGDINLPPIDTIYRFSIYDFIS